MAYYYDENLRRSIERLLLPDIQLPGQYIGGELGQIVKNPASVRGRFCFAFPDVYTIGMSNTALSLLYAIMNRQHDWACERAFCPFPDMERKLRENDLPLYSLETFTPLSCFDVVGFTFQYELCYTNVLTMLDLGRIPLHRWERSAQDPLVIAGGPGVFNPEPMSPFIDAFIIGDGEEALPQLCAFWKDLCEKRALAPQSFASDSCSDAERSEAASSQAGSNDLDSNNADSNAEPSLKTPSSQSVSAAEPGLNVDSSSENVERAAVQEDGPLPLTRMISQERREMLYEVARQFPWVYVPEFYEVRVNNGRALRPRPIQAGIPETIVPAIVRSLDDFPPPEHPLVPLVESVQDRVSIEIMRGCPQKCRFCQSSPIKRPLRKRSIDQIVQAAKTATQETGIQDVTLLSLSSSEYPGFEKLIEAFRQELTPCGVSLAVPSLRVDHQLSQVMENLSTERSSSITMAPEAARDSMRRRIAKNVTNENLMKGCRAAFENNFYRIKLYFMCGFPEETEADLDGIVELCDQIALLGKEIRGRFPTIIANVSNFVPKPQTPLQWHAMATADYLRNAHIRMKTAKHLRSVEIKYHELKTSLLEGLMTRGDRRIGQVIETAWQKGARLDAWTEYFKNDLWQEAIQECGIDVQRLVHTPYQLDDELPWDHISIYEGREKLRKEYELSRIQDDEFPE